MIDKNYIMDHIASCYKCISMPVDKALEALHTLAFENKDGCARGTFLALCSKKWWM